LIASPTAQVLLACIAATASARLLSSQAPGGAGGGGGPTSIFPRAAEGVQQFFDESSGAVDKLLRRLRSRSDGDAEASSQPEFAGSWKTYKSVNLDDFLDRSMGVGYLKRTIALKASQTQRLHREGNIVHLEISDRRGTSRYILHPDGREHSGYGFMKLPIRQRAKWARDGSLLVEERYSVHLGGEEHGTKCRGDSCPVVRSRRSVDRKSGMMLVEIERTLLSGEVLKTSTYYAAVDS